MLTGSNRSKTAHRYRQSPLAITCNSSTSPHEIVKSQLLYIKTVLNEGAPVDPLEIEETSDWLGCPTPLETCRHQLRIYENEVEELTLQLRQAREKIFTLVEMHTETAGERDALRSQLAAAKAEASRLHGENYELSSKVRSLLLVSDQRDHLFRENQRLLMERTGTLPAP